MFDHPKKRYMTSSIQQALHPEIAMHLWNLIDDQRKQGLDVDYLQVFELTIIKEKQSILHRQEIPTYREQWMVEFKYAEPVTTTVWCIDDGANQTMLYPSDY